jgi:crotonobetainyl-CoA:carnitine CoA-transferase CaiB-like acyl-CoA transferase
MIQEVSHTTLGVVPTLGFPISFYRSPVEVARGAPILGEHTGEVLRELGYSEHAITQLERQSVIRRAASPQG